MMIVILSGVMDERKRVHNRRQYGFTLIEITVAILVLAGSLVVLLGLQSSSLQRTIRDGNMERAMLGARSIMSALESSDVELEVGDREGTVAELVEGFVQLDADDRAAMDSQTDLQARMQVEFWPLPGIDNEQVLQKITLTVSWSESPLDRVTVVYMLPHDEFKANQ